MGVAATTLCHSPPIQPPAVAPTVLVLPPLFLSLLLPPTPAPVQQTSSLGWSCAVAPCCARCVAVAVVARVGADSGPSTARRSRLPRLDLLRAVVLAACLCVVVDDVRASAAATTAIGFQCGVFGSHCCKRLAEHLLCIGSNRSSSSSGSSCYQSLPTSKPSHCIHFQHGSI